MTEWNEAAAEKLWARYQERCDWLATALQLPMSGLYKVYTGKRPAAWLGKTLRSHTAAFDGIDGCADDTPSPIAEMSAGQLRRWYGAELSFLRDADALVRQCEAAGESVCWPRLYDRMELYLEQTAIDPEAAALRTLLRNRSADCPSVMELFLSWLGVYVFIPGRLVRAVLREKTVEILQLHRYGKPEVIAILDESYPHEVALAEAVCSAFGSEPYTMPAQDDALRQQLLDCLRSYAEKPVQRKRYLLLP